MDLMMKTLWGLPQGLERDVVVSKLVVDFIHVFVLFYCVSLENLFQVSNCLFNVSCRGNSLQHFVLSPSPSPKSLPCYIETQAKVMDQCYPSPILVSKRRSYNVVVKKFLVRILDLEANVQTLGFMHSDSSEASDHSSSMCGIGSNWSFCKHSYCLLIFNVM